jgi:hypothetical protein
MTVDADIALLDAASLLVPPSERTAFRIDHEQHHTAIDDALQQHTALSADEVLQWLGSLYQAPTMSAQELLQAPPLRLLPARVVAEQRWFPLRLDAAGLHIAMTAPLRPQLLVEVGGALGLTIVPVLTTTSALQQALRKHWDVAVPTLLPRVATPVPAPPQAASFDRPALRWSVADARAELVLAEDRDSLWAALLRFCACSVPVVAGLVRKREQWVAWALINDGRARDVRGEVVPAHGLLTSATTAKGGMFAAPGADDGLASWLGQTPRTLLLLPIELDGRCIGMVVGHAHDKPVRPQALLELTLVLPLFVQQLRRMLLSSRVQLPVPSSTSLDAPMSAELQRMSTPSPSMDTRPLPPSLSLIAEVEPSSRPPSPLPPTSNAVPSAPALHVVAAVVPPEQDDDAWLAPTSADAALHQRVFARWQAAEASSSLPKHVSLARLWPRTSDVVIARLPAPTRITFSMAALTTKERGRVEQWWPPDEGPVPEVLLAALLQMAVDDDADAREVALSLLGRAQRERGLDDNAWQPHLNRVRDLQLRGTDAVRLRAIDLLRVLRDVGAADAWMEALELHPHPLADAARTALLEVFVEDHGHAARRWRAHVSDHGHEPRREWLVRGLEHKSRAVRDFAAVDVDVQQPGLLDEVGYDPAGTSSERAHASKQVRARWSL